MANVSSTVAPPIYGGDEVSAIVLDPGSFSTRVGYAGEDCPRYIVPSYFSSKEESDGDVDLVGQRIFGESIDLPRGGQNISPIVQEGSIIDWDAAQEQYSYLFDGLKIDYEEQPLLMTEPVWNSVENRSRSLEMGLEHFQFPGFYLAKQPTCASFASARPNCLIVDIGHDICSVTPVIDGICLVNNTMKTHYAGRYLSKQFVSLLGNKFVDLDLTNKYEIKSKITTIYDAKAQYQKKSFDFAITKSFEEYQREKIYHEMKETLIQVPHRKLNVAEATNKKDAAKAEDLEKYSDEESRRLFELPTGQSIEFGIDRFQVGDAMFDPESYELPVDLWSYEAENGEPVLKGYDYKPLKRARKINDETQENTPDPSNSKESSSTGDSSVPKYRGLSQVVNQAIQSIDIDIRAAIAHNIVITGGSSLVPGLTERLNTELSALNPALKIRIHAAGSTIERLNLSWIGGSVLASLGTFHQLWISKQEYEEVGIDRLLSQRLR